MSRLRHTKPPMNSFTPGVDKEDAEDTGGASSNLMKMAKSRTSIGVIGGEKAKSRMDRRRGGRANT